MRSVMAITAAAVSGWATSTASSPVGKVLDLLNELKDKINADLSNESSSMAEYTQFCDDEASEKGFAIRTAAKSIDGFSATIEDTTGQIQELGARIDAASQEVAAKGDELSSASSVRKDQHDDFQAAEKELVDAVDTLSRAIVIIKREMSFAQGAKGSPQTKKLAALSAALSTVIDASWLDVENRQKLTALMSTEEDDELSIPAGPQASSSNYTNQSGGIVETLEDMKDKAESQLQNLRKEETKSRQSFELIKQSLTDAVTNKNNEIEEQSSNRSGAQEKLGKAQGDLSETSAAKAADEKYLENLNNDCASKANEWSERQKSAADELAALAKAHEILSGKFGFLQTKAAVHTADSRERLQKLLRKLGRKYNSFGLMQLANSSQNDPFVKIRGLIEGMIDKLLKQAQDEATHEAFCQEETKKSNASRDKKAANADKIQARIDQAKAGKQQLANEVNDLLGEISAIEKSNAAAAQLRSQENGDYKKASKDFKEAIEAVSQAMVVLKDFYRGDVTTSHANVALVQQPDFADTRGDAGHSIIEILEVAESDFTRLLAESETGEAEAAKSYETLRQDNKVAKATKNASVKGKNSEMKAIEVALNNSNEDFATVSKELDAVIEYISKLKPQCESKAMTYEERKARRDAEIAGLKEALEILGSDASLIQKSTKFLSK